MRTFITLSLLFIFQVVFSKAYDYKVLSEEIFANNRNGRYADSKNKLINILKSNNFNDKELAELNILIAITYKSMEDYPLSLKYLFKAKQHIIKFDRDDNLYLNILAELSFCYFDIQNFRAAAEIVDIIESKDYSGIVPLNKAYLLLQKGYIYFLRKDFSNCKFYYDRALLIVNQSAPCHRPIVLAKYMQLYGKQKRLKDVKSTYNEAYENIDSCNMFKYKIYLTKVISSIYREHQFKDNDNYDKLLDSLEFIDNSQILTSPIIMEQNYDYNLQGEAEEKMSNFPIIIITLTVIIVIQLIWYSFRLKKRNQVLKGKLVDVIGTTSDLTEVSELNNNIITGGYFDEVTDRQNEIISLILEGYSNKEIAEKIFLSEATVKYHIKNIYEKLEIKNRNELLSKVYNKK